MDFREEAYLCWQHRIPGMTEEMIGRLRKSGITARDLKNMSLPQLEEVLTAHLAGRVLEMQKEEPERTLEGYYRRGISFIPAESDDYPEKLKTIRGRPKSVWLIGRLPDPKCLSIAIIGARKCSEYGRYIAQYYGTGLGSLGVQIISGLAEGIDGISQNAAVKEGAYSLAVLGSGVDVCYPRCNIRLYERLKEEGGILSEYPPGTSAMARNFPPRNRIISALSDALIVVEAGKKSGTLITVEYALLHGREVWAVPGRVTEHLSDGCNSLIRQGAHAATLLPELIEDLRRNIPGAYFASGEPEAETEENSMPVGTGGVTDVLRELRLESHTADELALLTGRDIGQLLGLLCDMELDGAIECVNGRYYKSE